MTNVLTKAKERFDLHLELFQGEEAQCTIEDNTLTVALLSTKLSRYFGGTNTGVKVVVGLKDSDPTPPLETVPDTANKIAY